jgi:hypothetical protein
MKKLSVNCAQSLRLESKEAFNSVSRLYCFATIILCWNHLHGMFRHQRFLSVPSPCCRALLYVFPRTSSKLEGRSAMSSSEMNPI